MLSIISIITLVCILLIVYHHVVYPYVLKRIAARSKHFLPFIYKRTYKESGNDGFLPSMTIIMPAYNEAKFIAEKIRNLAQLDYPKDKLKVEVHCDGCTDNTAEIAKKVIIEPECQWLNISVHAYPVNRGKRAVINQAVEMANGDIVVLTDVSALLPIDALLSVAAHFRSKQVGAVSGGYRLLNSRIEGEETYWQYQSTIKRCESATGSVLGCHGAFYAFRRALYRPLDADVINDDFVLPMSIAEAGYSVVYEPRVSSIELEQVNPEIDAKRRIRIAAGNLQQLFKLYHLLSPRYGWLAFNFASGKALRSLMPFCLLIVLIGSIILAFDSWIYLGLAIGQLAVYGYVALIHLFELTPAHKLMRIIDYVVCGHWSGLVGATRYLLGIENGRWNRVGE